MCVCRVVGQKIPLAQAGVVGESVRVYADCAQIVVLQNDVDLQSLFDDSLVCPNADGVAVDQDAEDRDHCSEPPCRRQADEEGAED